MAITSGLIFQVILIGLGLWVLFQYLIPKLPEPARMIVTVIIVALAIVWVLQLMGFIG